MRLYRNGVKTPSVQGSGVCLSEKQTPQVIEWINLGQTRALHSIVKRSLNLVCLRFWLGLRFRLWRDLVNSHRWHLTDFVGESLLTQMRVPLRHANVGVAELLSDFGERQPLPRPSTGGGMPQFVEGK
jgi:hypothetical protein